MICILTISHLQAVAIMKAHGDSNNKIWGVASTGNDVLGEAIKETTGRSAFQTMGKHFKWDSMTCRLCPTVASLHLLPPELIEIMNGSKKAEIEAVQLMKEEAKKPGSSIMGPPSMSQMDSVGAVLTHLQTGSVIFNHNRRGESNATMTGFFIINDATQNIQDGTLDLPKFKTNPYRDPDSVVAGSGGGSGRHYSNHDAYRCPLNQLAYGRGALRCTL